MKAVALSKTGSKNKGLIAIVDDCDFEIVNRYNWSADDHGHTFYAKCWIAGKLVYLHNFISGFSETDHIDRNGLNNVRGNLRHATRQQNMMNKQKQKGNYASRFKGVTFRKNRSTWIARVMVDDKYNYLGSYKTETDAALAYNEKVKELYGEFASLNNIS